LLARAACMMDVCCLRYVEPFLCTFNNNNNNSADDF